MLDKLTPLERHTVESVYQVVISSLTQVGSKTGTVIVAYSHKAGRIVCIRSSDDRYETVSKDLNYEVIATYSGVPRPRLRTIAGDVLAYFDEQEASAIRG